MDHPTQSSCPYCLSPEGYVRRVTISKDDQRTFTFTCDKCKHSWDGEAHPSEHPDQPWARPVEDQHLHHERFLLA